MTTILVNIDVSDLAAAERFYCEAFDLQPARRFGSGAVELVGANARVYLLEKEAGSRGSSASEDLRSYDRHWTPVHLDFVVDDLEQAIGRSLVAGGVQEQPTRENDWGRIALMADPFGNGYCLVEFSAEGYDAIAAPA